MIISRVNLEMDLDPYKYEDPKPWKSERWNQRRVMLLNQFARASLKKQTCQDFVFITLWNPNRAFDFNNCLPNEHIMFVERMGTLDDLPLDYKALETGKPGKRTLNYADQITWLVDRRYGDGAPLLITNLDCDDCLKFDFVEKLQEAATSKDIPDRDFYFLDVEYRYMYNLKDGRKGMKKRESASPFVSTIERKKIQCIPLRYNHSVLPTTLQGKKVKGLLAMQTIGDTNIFQRSVGNKCNFNLGDYFE